MEYVDGTNWIWMEDIRDAVGTWSLEDYRGVARCLGQFNGAYLVGKPLPDYPWLSRRWLRQYVEHAAPALCLLLEHCNHPLIRRIFLDVTPAFIQQTWDARYAFLSAIEALPQTFCHLDAFRRNLFLRELEGRHEPTAVDWSYCGIASLGEEIAPLVHASVGLGAVGPADELALEQTVLEGYLAGLRDAGWRGDPDLVRFGYAATVYWRYMIGAFIGEVIPWMLDACNRAQSEEDIGVSMQHAADLAAKLSSFAHRTYEQAQRLKTKLTL
jgi:hypothetical protein